MSSSPEPDSAQPDTPDAGEPPAAGARSEPEEIPEPEGTADEPDEPSEPEQLESESEEPEQEEPEPEPEPETEPEAADAAPPAARRRFGLTKVLVAALLALLGFSLAVQVRSVAEDPALAALGQEDLVRILANLDAHEQRLQEEISDLEDAKRGLTTEGQSQQEALAEAERRADELGVLAGTLPVEGPGLVVTLVGPAEAVNATRLLDAVQELRGAGAEAIQVDGGNGRAVRVVASTYFVDTADGTQIEVDGRLLSGPYTLTVIGDPGTLAPALTLPGGVAETVAQGGGTVNVNEPEVVAVTEVVTAPPALRYARPAS